MHEVESAVFVLFGFGNESEGMIFPPRLTLFRQTSEGDSRHLQPFFLYLLSNQIYLLKMSASEYRKRLRSATKRKRVYAKDVRKYDAKEIAGILYFVCKILITY